jgi:hypothetical protein
LLIFVEVGYFNLWDIYDLESCFEQFFVEVLINFNLFLIDFEDGSLLRCIFGLFFEDIHLQIVVEDHLMYFVELAAQQLFEDQSILLDPMLLAARYFWV